MTEPSPAAVALGEPALIEPHGGAPEIRTAFIATLVGFALLGLLTALHWPGARVDCPNDMCFCETAHGPPLEQPANSLSNLGVVAAAFLTAGLWGRARRLRKVPSKGLDMLGRLFPIAMVFQGLGSMAFHMSLARVGGALDALSMFFVVALMLMTQFYRLGWLAAPRILPVWLLFVVPMGAIGIAVPLAIHVVMFSMLVSLLATEVVASRREPNHTAWRFRAGIGCHILGVLVWTYSGAVGPEFPLCFPDSLWQGHALWHLTEAAVVSFFAAHARVNMDRTLRAARAAV
jgi:hypothetical protein